MKRFGSGMFSGGSVRRIAGLLVLSAAVGIPASAQTGALKPAEEEGRISETYAEPGSGTVLNTLAGLATQFVPPSAGVEGTTSMPRRTFERSAGVVSKRVGYEAANQIERMTSIFEPQRVIDNDWKRVTNTKLVPYRAVCYLEADWPNNVLTAGTAFFVGKRVLLTNAHAVYDRKKKRWASEVRIYPGRDGSHSPFGSDVNYEVHIPTAYTTAKDADAEDYDIAWIILPSHNLFDKIGYTFGLMTTTTPQLTAMDLNSAGYPGTKNEQQWRDFETKNQIVRPMQFDHYHDIVGGSSGSPMYKIEKKERYVVGLVTWEYDGRRANGGTRITNDYFDWTKQFIKQYP